MFNPKRLCNFAETLLIISLGRINISLFGKKMRKNSKRKKIQLQVSKSGVFSKKKCSANFLKFGTLLEHLKLFCLILENLRKTFSVKKSNFKFQKSGNFGSNSLWEIGEVQILKGKSALFFFGWRKKCSANLLKLRS